MRHMPPTLLDPICYDAHLTMQSATYSLPLIKVSDLH